MMKDSSALILELYSSSRLLWEATPRRERVLGPSRPEFFVSINRGYCDWLAQEFCTESLQIVLLILECLNKCYHLGRMDYQMPSAQVSQLT